MWDFLKAILEHGGTTAAFFFLSMFAGGLALRALWKKTHTLHDRIVELQAAAEKSKREAAEAYAEALRAGAEKGTARLEELARRVDDLQERRVKEAREVTEKVVKHIGHIDATVDKLGTAVDVLIDMSGGRRR